jgi:two-component system sensor histidine kinase DevS
VSVNVPALSPGRWLLVGAIGCLLGVLLTVAMATRSPWLGLQLAAAGEPGEKQAGVLVVSARGPSAQVPAGATLLAVASEGGAPIALSSTDLIDEPDYFDLYSEMDAFFVRQTELSRALSSPRVALSVRTGTEERTVLVEPIPSRPLSTLPVLFWFQLCAGSIGLLVSLWVLVLRPRVTGVQMFALAGVMIFGFTAPAAVYSTRELAIEGGIFRVLSSLNHLGANLFGIGLVGIFVMFPKSLVRPRFLWILPAVFLGWFVLDTTRLAPNQSWGARAPIMLEMLLAIVFAVVQWRSARNDPRARASLRWFGVCVVTGASLFVFSVVAPTLFGMVSPIPQGYSFGFFLLMHVGLALGLRQTRLFELGELAWIVLFWVVGAIALVVFDAALLMLLNASRLVSSAVALFVVGLAYLPVRSWVWSRALSRKKIDENMLFRRVLDVVFAVEPEVRAHRWTELFEALFSPLEIESFSPEESEIRAVVVKDDGLRMDLPSVTTLPALRLAFPWRGRGLFGERHSKLAIALLELAEHAENARNAFDRGVREERARVARDLHDDVGAALTSALHQQDPNDVREAVRGAIREMRSMVSQLTGRRLRLTDAVGELRYEAVQRLAAAGVAPEWPIRDLGETTIHSSVARNLGSMVRELTSNVIKHAQAKTMSVAIVLEEKLLVVTLLDDGVGFDTEQPNEGNGLWNLRRRAKDLGGAIVFTRRDRGMAVRIELPLDPVLRPEVGTATDAARSIS